MRKIWLCKNTYVTLAYQTKTQTAMKTKNVVFSIGFALTATALITTNALFAVAAFGIAAIYGASEFLKGSRLS